jgi:methionyl-tRNA synthetase
MVRRAQAAGDIYQGKYEGWYCKSCETYYLESDLAEGLCPVHRIQPAWLAENNYFFRLSKYTEKIKHHIESHPEFIQPETRRNEMLNILKEGLRDISVSRSSSQWGIPFPGDSSQIVYVWFDALINYISGIGFPDDMPHFEKFWPAEVHVIGKDITRFHCLIWPAMLMSASLPLPKRVFGHGFINLKGEKISKTKGNVLDPLELVDQYGLDAFRYVLLATSHYAGDADFTLPGFIERYNADLANDLGNLLNRTLAMAHKFCQGKVPAYGQEPSAIRLQLERMEGLADRVGSRIEAFDFDGALLQIMDVVNHANKLIDQAAPWALFKQQALDPLGSVMRCLLETLHAVSVLLGPFMPETGIRMRQQLGLPQTEACRLLNGPAVWEQLSIGQELQQGKPIFPRLEVA